MLNKPATAADIQDMINWLEPKAKRAVVFNYQDTSHCLIAQYLKDRGFSRPFVGSTMFHSDANAISGSIPDVIVRIAKGGQDEAYSIDGSNMIPAANALMIAREEHVKMVYGIKDN